MISHVHLGVSDFDRALSFYDALLPTLGWRLRFIDLSRPWAGWQPPGTERPLFLIGVPFDGAPFERGNGAMVALAASRRAEVDRAHECAVAAGGRDEGVPGLRPEYHANYYGAYFRDPDGNKICVCCHQPEPA